MSDSRHPEASLRGIASADGSRCPTPEQWQFLEMVESIAEADPAIVAHVESCPICLSRLDGMTSASRSAFDAILKEVDPKSNVPLQVIVPKGYELAGEPVFGGRGIVMKLREVDSGRFTALKIPNQRWKITEFERSKLKAESEAIACLDHPGIVKLIQVLMEEDPPSIMMTWVEGCNLQERLIEREPETKEAVQLIRELTEAVAHAHERGILHRDIKPSNVMISGEGFGQIQLCDFGLAKMKSGIQDWSTGTSLIGTPGYMAPELLRNETGKIGPAVDVFSIGVVMYRLLSGKMPFDGVNPIALGIQVLYQEPMPIRRLRTEIPEALDSICLKCLSKEPEDRYADAGELRADLDRFIKGKAVIAGRNSYLQSIRRWAKREPKVAALVGGFVGFLTLAVFILAILLEKSRLSEERAIENANQARINGELAEHNESVAESRLNESVRAMSLASPIFKRFLKDYELKSEEISKITEFARLREDLDAEPARMKERLNHHFLTLELADCLRNIEGQREAAIELASLAREKIGKMIRDHREEAANEEYGSIPSENFRITVLEKAWLRYGQACSQLHGSYERRLRIGMGEQPPEGDPGNALMKEAVESAKEALRLNPRLDEAVINQTDYLLTLLLDELANGRKENAIQLNLKSIGFAEYLLDSYPNDFLRWQAAAVHRSTLARLYLEPPADFPASSAALTALEERFFEEAKLSRKLREQALVLMWFEMVWTHRPLLSIGKFDEAIKRIDRITEMISLADPRYSESPGVLREQNLLKLDRLCLMKLANASVSDIEAARMQLQADFDRIADPVQKELAKAYLAVFGPVDDEGRTTFEEGSPAGISAIKKQWYLEFMEMILKSTNENLTEQYEAVAFKQIENLRFHNNSGMIMKLLFKLQQTVADGDQDQAGKQMVKWNQWIENDRLVPAFIRLKLDTIRKSVAK